MRWWARRGAPLDAPAPGSVASQPHRPTEKRGAIRFRAFRAWRPDPAIVERVASPPYDVVSRDEAATLAAGNPLSFLHVVRSDIDLPPETDPYDPAVYRKAARNFEGLLRDFFVQDPEPSVYLYELTLEGRSQLGVVGLLHVEDYENSVIRRHEKTRQDKEDDRTRHILALNAQAEPVLIAHEPSPFLIQLNHKVTGRPPLFDYTAYGVRHRGWRVGETQAYGDALRRLGKAYIADGHHRSASAWRAAGELKAANPKHTGNEEYNWFLAVLFPSTQLRILPYHRVVKDLNGMTPERFFSRLAAIGVLAAALCAGSIAASAGECPADRVVADGKGQQAGATGAAEANSAWEWSGYEWVASEARGPDGRPGDGRRSPEGRRSRCPTERRLAPQGRRARRRSRKSDFS